MRSSDLSDKICNRIIREIEAGHLTPGQHVAAQNVADRYGVSRTPIREALNSLCEQGLLIREPNRGFFVSQNIPTSLSQNLKSFQASDREAYHLLAGDWLTNSIPEEVTEQFLRDRYNWTKSKVSELLVRAAKEGWAEPKEGYGWRFLPVAKTPEAFDEIYRFRLTIEPAAMLEPSFNIDRRVLGEQRGIQERMLEMDTSALPDQTLLENGSLFHEEIIKLSGNPFFLMALQQVNRMRRLMEYRAEINVERLIEQCTEHLEIIELLEKGKVVDASYLMRQHLSGALKRKSPIARSWASDVATN